uniref:Serpin peptidase inhibitor, clade E (nexin, plasminogen activator inhibitor type 1), member 3 n=1 Tax=Poecilia formosa TaxID=48698 RepID=A0A096MHP4_POEFO
MRRLPLASVFVFLWLAERSHCTGSFQDSMRELHNRFAVSLYQTLTEAENRSNLIASPASVSLSLALLQLGARGNTRAQLEGTLGYNVNGVGLALAAHFAQTQVTVKSKTDKHLSCLNAIKEKRNLLIKLLSCQHRQTSQLFGQGPKLFCFVLFRWVGVSPVRKQQRGDVRLRRSPGRSPLPQVALVNTVAFRGVWQKQFMFGNTQNLPFVLTDGSAVKVPMMYQAGEVSFGQFRTSSDQRYTVLELPYLGRALSLQVVLPSDRKSPLSSLESQLTARQLASWESGLRRTKMDIFLPRFRMQNKFSLRSVLPALGVSDAFNPTAADFTGISAEEGLYVSDAVHEVRIEVAEDGTKAAAATAMVLLKRSRAPVFKADRPFLFLLRQVNTAGSILFMGRIMNP